MAGMTEKQAESLDLVYGLEDKPPFGNALLSAVTHLLAIFVPMITPALIVGGALELPVEMTAYLVSMAMVASGVGTYLQVNRFGPVGSGYVVDSVGQLLFCYRDDCARYRYERGRLD